MERSPSAEDVAELTRLNQDFTNQEGLGPGGEQFFTGVLRDDLCFRRANGTVVDKATFLTGLSNPGNTNEILAGDVRQVSVAGDWAIVEVMVRLKGTRGG